MVKKLKLISNKQLDKETRCNEINKQEKINIKTSTEANQLIIANSQ